MVNIRGAAIAAVISCGLAAASHAETLHYYYVSGPTVVSNQEDAADRILFNAGHLTIDRTELPDGPSLANRTLQSYWGAPGNNAGNAVSFQFREAEADEFRILFDADGNIVDWQFSNFVIGGAVNDYSWVSTFGDSVVHESPYAYIADLNARYFLDRLGYKEGTPEFESLRCGSWAGPQFDCGSLGETAQVWSAEYVTEAGTWYRDVLGFASGIEAVTQASLANPPASYLDIQPIPLPAPLALLLGGVAGLALTSTRFRVRRSAS